MTNVLPLSSTRVTAALTRDRITQQVQGDQNELFRLQQQLSTGLRIFVPSDDASAAQRAMALQRTLERKEQSVTNLQGANSALVDTEASLANVSNLLASLKGEALGVVDTISTDTQRLAVVNTIDQLLLDLQRIGNATFTETYVLGGAEIATEPYGAAGTFVEYYGDESSPQTFVDLGFLFDSGTAGDEVLGGLSESIRGFVDLNPRLTPETRLSRLNGGLGVSSNGSISIEFDTSAPGDPIQVARIDLGSAESIEDVARLIEAGAPEDAEIVVQLRGNGLHLSTSQGTLTVSEVADGDTARELGILTTGVPAAAIQGTDLNPVLAKTDRLDDLTGAKAQGRIVSPGLNNDLFIIAEQNGASFNGLTVDYVTGATAGAETATYDGLTNTLTVQIAPGVSTAAQVAAAINATTPFTATPDYRDQSTTTTAGTGTVAAGTSLGVGIEGGSGTTIDLAGGLQVTNGPDTYTIDTSAAVTVEDLLNELNRPEYGLAATINEAGDGLDVRTRRSGADFTIGENGGDTATDLGIRTYTGDTNLSDFNRGIGVVLATSSDSESPVSNDLQIVVSDQGTTSTFDVDVTDAVTVQDVIDEIGAATGGLVTASLATVGNGLVLTRNDAAVDAAATATGTATVGGDTLTVTADTPGAAGNQAFDLTVIDGGSGGLTVDVTGDSIVVDLGGATPDTGVVAAAISAALPNHTVTAPGTPSAATVTALQPFAAAGGYDADALTISGGVAQRLGFFADDETSATSGSATLASDDRHTLEVDSVFTTLIRMREALLGNETEQLGRELNRLDDDIDRVTFGRGEIGVRLRTLEDIGNRLADEEVELRSALSLEIDADLVEVASDLAAQQASLEASLRVSATLLSISILDFI